MGDVNGSAGGSIVEVHTVADLQSVSIHLTTPRPIDLRIKCFSGDNIVCKRKSSVVSWVVCSAQTIAVDDLSAFDPSESLCICLKHTSVLVQNEPVSCYKVAISSLRVDCYIQASKSEVWITKVDMVNEAAVVYDICVRILPTILSWVVATHT